VNILSIQTIADQDFVKIEINKTIDSTFEIKMSIYGKTAIDAAELVCKGVDPLNAWQECIVRQTNSVASQKKSCPKTVFLTLAKIHKRDLLGVTETSSANEKLTFETLMLLTGNSELSKNKNKKNLWNALDTGTNHNMQLDVILSIWNSELFSLNLEPLQKNL
jgi:hypothetical protein